jgi:WD40 repeat protein
VKGFAENWYYTSWFNDDIAQLRSYADGSVIRRLVSATTGGSSAIATSSSGKLIATTGYYFKGGDFVDSSIKIWDSGTGGLITTLSNRQWLPYRLVFSKDERLVASISDRNNPEVSAWNISDGRELLRLREKVPPSAGIDFLPDSRTLVYGSMKALEFWDVFSGNRVATITKEASFITAVSAAGDGKTVAVGRMDGTVVVYNTPTTDPLTMTATTDGLSLNFKARSSVVYVVEASSDLKSWRNVTTVTGTGENVRVGVNPEETTFYRLR